MLSIEPTTNVGAVTQQGVIQHRVDQIPQLDGTGITIGVLSDSYNTAPNFLVRWSAAYHTRGAGHRKL